MSKNCHIEIAVQDLEQAITAENLGADRIELCTHLSEGGTTPHYGLIRTCVQYLSIPVYVMIRPRAGDFHYSEKEVEVMLHDIEISAELGAAGVVFGLLNKDMTLDLSSTKKLVDQAKKHQLKTTFHRAIDVSASPHDTIIQLIDWGFENILTSGNHAKALDGIDNITDYHSRYGDRINIMAGSGIHAQNVKAFLDQGIRNIHFTSQKRVSNNDRFDFGTRMEYDTKKTKDIIDEVRRYFNR